MSERENPTLRKWLTAAGFDWDDGRILYQKRGEDPNEDDRYGDVTSATFIEPTHPILDKQFYDGFGGAECPCIVAEDSKRIYFPGQYDGSTWLDWVEKDLTYYLDPKHSTPYPGGG